MSDKRSALRRAALRDSHKDYDALLAATGNPAVAPGRGPGRRGVITSGGINSDRNAYYGEFNDKYTDQSHPRHAKGEPDQDWYDTNGEWWYAQDRNDQPSGEFAQDVSPQFDGGGEGDGAN